jgi:hypothetical protein
VSVFTAVGSTIPIAVMLELAVRAGGAVVGGSGTLVQFGPLR